MFAIIVGMFCILPAIVGIYKFKQMDAVQHPFVYSIWLSVMVEVIARWAWFAKNKQVYNTNYNVFMVLNFALCLWFFSNLKVIKKTWVLILIAVSIVLKFSENHYFTQWHLLNISSIFECAFLIIFSVKILAQNILFTEKKLVISPIFIITISLLVLNLFDILNTILGWIFPISKSLTNTVNTIFVVVNALVYITYTHAFLCTQPNKK